MKIPSPKGIKVRPTLDRIKENIFNILQFNIEKKACLDLFCGSGALGLECLSRGANFVDFVDNDERSIYLLKKFLLKIKEKNYALHNEDYYDALKNFKKSSMQFDIIFIDPPYMTDLATKAIGKILKFNLLRESGLIVWEHLAKTISPYIKRTKDSRVYGKVAVDFISK